MAKTIPGLIQDAVEAKRAEAELKKASAFSIIKFVMENRAELYPCHVKELLNIAIWKISEAEGGKYKTRFRSKEYMRLGPKVERRHDHVFRREVTVKEILAQPSFTNALRARILERSVACVVTDIEHSRLCIQDRKGIDGWSRYTEAKVE